MKPKGTIKLISLTCLSAALSVVALAAVTGLFTNIPTGFNRNLNGLKPKLTHQVQVPGDASSIVGVKDGQILLNSKRANLLYAYRLNLALANSVYLNLNNTPPLTRNIAHEILDSTIYTFAGNVKGVFENGTLKDSQNRSARLSYSFTRGIPLSKGNYILRVFDPAADKKDQYFIKAGPYGTISNYNRATPRFDDAGIATDGMLHYDTSNHIVTYTYFYSNRILCMDTNLKLLYILNTIDTFASFHNRGIEINEGNGRTKVTSDRPPRMGNLSQSISKGLLYNLSLTKADNERKNDFKENSVIDLYDIKQAKYLYSLYLPNIQGKKVRDIYVYNNILIALYNGHLATFALRQF